MPINILWMFPNRSYCMQSLTGETFQILCNIVCIFSFRGKLIISENSIEISRLVFGQMSPLKFYVNNSLIRLWTCNIILQFWRIKPNQDQVKKFEKKRDILWWPRPMNCGPDRKIKLNGKWTFRKMVPTTLPKTSTFHPAIYAFYDRISVFERTFINRFFEHNNSGLSLRVTWYSGHLRSCKK